MQNIHNGTWKVKKLCCYVWYELHFCLGKNVTVSFSYGTDKYKIEVIKVDFYAPTKKLGEAFKFALVHPSVQKNLIFYIQGLINF